MRSHVVFFFGRKEYREPTAKLVDFLPWARLAAPGIIQHKTGILQTTFCYRGPDLESETPLSQMIMMDRLNHALMQFGSGWALFFEAQRVPTKAYPSLTSFPDPLSALVEDIRRINFTSAGNLHETLYYLTLTYKPPSEKKRKFFDFLFEGGARTLDNELRLQAEVLKTFETTVKTFVNTVRSNFVMIKPLSDEEMLTYLHATISPKRHPIAVPPKGLYLDSVLADTPMKVGTELYLGGHQVKVIGVKGFPGHTLPGLLEALSSLDFPYRWCTRYIFMGSNEAKREIRRYESRLYQNQNKLRDQLSDQESALKDRSALRSTESVGEVLEELGQDNLGAGYMTLNVVVHHKDPRICELRAERLQEVINARGFATVDEGPNIFSAWLSTLPGHPYANVRRPIITTLNLAHLLPVQSTWSGDEGNTHLNHEAAHLYCVTQGSTPFRLNLNVGDVGHTLIFGPTGAGKSVLLSVLQLQWLKYEDAQVFVFDKKRSSRATCLSCEGVFLELSVSNSDVTFQPLARIHESKEFAFASKWLEELFFKETGRPITVSERGLMSTALRQVAHLPRHQRTLTVLTSQIQDRDLKLVLKDYCQGGTYGNLFDNASESLSLSSYLVMEMDELMEGAPRVSALTLSYLFHRLNERFEEKRPTLLILDEAWLMLDNEMFAARLRQWLKELRKYRVYVVFASQSLSDAMNSPIADTLFDNCLTRILLPNTNALTPNTKPYYKRLGLNDRQIELIATAQPKRQYYYTSPKGDRVFELNLSDLELAIVGASSPADQELIDQALRDQRTHGGIFAPHYLRRRPEDFSEFADDLEKKAPYYNTP